mmetsp:Transcript_14491/g.31626  ORF Transcript_14491/g.31626 Transcript_14491/m.31626 type:complete len:210 (+) Transcript_14491:1574-2203(+)
MNTYFVSKYSEIPMGDPSLPIPLSLTPPNGAELELMTPSFTPTNPHSNRRETSKARVRLSVQKYAAKPTGESLAIRIASSSSEKEQTAATGPKVSSDQIRLDMETFVNIVGWKKFGPRCSARVPPTKAEAPFSKASWTFSATREHASAAIKGPTSVDLSMPGPTTSEAVLVANLSTNSEKTDSCTKNRSAQTHVCPAFRNLEPIAASTA